VTSAGLQAYRSGVGQKFPGSGRMRVSARRRSAAPKDADKRAKGSPVCFPREQCRQTGARSCRTIGCERCAPLQVATRTRKDAGDRSAADAVKAETGGTGIDLNCVCRRRLCAVESRLRAAEHLSTQIVSSTGERTHRRWPRTLHAKPSSTLSNSTKGCHGWQWRSLSEYLKYFCLHIHRDCGTRRIHWRFIVCTCEYRVHHGRKKRPIATGMVRPPTNTSETVSPVSAKVADTWIRLGLSISIPCSMTTG
jgi:hypothetical protein